MRKLLKIIVFVMNSEFINSFDIFGETLNNGIFVVNIDEKM